MARMLGACTAWGRCACRDCHPAPGAKLPERRRQRARETRAWKRSTVDCNLAQQSQDLRPDERMGR